jgi:capsular exopolysaccharide synthesis family protein
LAITVGSIGGLAAAATCWFSSPTKFTAISLIQIFADSPKVLFKVDDNHSSFDLYKSTQMQLLTEDNVLAAALRAIPADAEMLGGEEDALRFLSRTLQVESPGNSEIIRVSLTGPNRTEVAAIVQAVVNSYMTEVVDKERSTRKNRLEELDAVYTAKEIEWRNRWTELKNLTSQIKTDDKGFAMLQYGEMRADWRNTWRELNKAVAELAAKTALLKARQEKPADASEIEDLMADDQKYLEIKRGLADIDARIAAAKHFYKQSSGAFKTTMDELTRARQDLEELLAAREQFVTRLNLRKSPDLELEVKNLKAHVDQMKDDYRTEEKAVDQQRIQIERLGGTSVDVEMTRAELKTLEGVLAEIGSQRQQLQIERDSQPRILVAQRAIPPAAPDKSSRLQNTITLGAFGFIAPIGLLLWWDVRGRRINTIRDISDGLGLTVIGTVPYITPGGAASGRGLQRHRRMQMCLDQSIDGIAAKLFLRRGSGGARVVLVSSATRGEGKSTLSIQLAKRLARTGATTLLLDFDLRKPSLHQVFDAPRGPGLTEFLRGGSELDLLIRETDVENLSILTAGLPFTDSLGTLTNGVTRSLFDKARAGFDFVIVDGSPIFPVVDALLASQHVDAVILSVRRDVSQVDRVRAACDQLEAFGVEQYVAVLTGSNEDFSYSYGDHELAAVESVLPLR